MSPTLCSNLLWFYLLNPLSVSRSASLSLYLSQIQIQIALLAWNAICRYWQMVQHFSISTCIYIGDPHSQCIYIGDTHSLTHSFPHSVSPFVVNRILTRKDWGDGRINLLEASTVLSWFYVSYAISDCDTKSKTQYVGWFLCGLMLEQERDFDSVDKWLCFTEGVKRCIYGATDVLSVPNQMKTPINFQGLHPAKPWTVL